MPQITLDARELADLELIATGAASPLVGLPRPRPTTVRCWSACAWPTARCGRCPSPWPWTTRTRDLLRAASEAALGDASGRVWGVIRVEDVFKRDPLEESRAVYGTEDATHPGVAYLLGRPRTLVGGTVRVLPLPETSRSRATA